MILVLACVLALSSADTATVGAAAIYLREKPPVGLNISNTDIGLLVAVSAVVGALASVPFGMLADRVRRTWTLGAAIVLWGTAMIWSATAGSFGGLLLSRLGLGFVTACAGPVVASLVGDYFRGGERGKIYSYVLTGELIGAGVGFTITGDVAALSWRASFVILALAAFPLAWAVFKLPEPKRGGSGALALEELKTPPGNTPGLAPKTEAAPQTPWAPHDLAGQQQTGSPRMTDAQLLAIERGLVPDRELVRRARRPRMGILSATSYVLAIRTNVALIISSACGYYFLSGVQTFGVEFVRGQYKVNQALANLLMLVIGGGAAIGIMTAGPGGDALLRRGRIKGRVLIAALAATITVVLFIPALVTTSVVTALPYLVFAAAALSAQNPPIDAARLDIMPAALWGRAEGIRTFLRTMAQALAPLLFGFFSDHVFGGGTAGLKWTFIVMLLPLSASAFFLFRAMRTYPTDVATAGAVSMPEPEPEAER